MTHTHKLIAGAIAAFAFTALAQTSTGSSTSTSGDTTSGTSGTTSSTSSPTTNSATGDSTTTMSDQTSTTTTQMARDPATIRQVQQALRDRGPIDGVWGTRSQAGLRDFQRSQGISASGSSSFDQRTLSALGVQGSGTATGTSTGAGLGTSTSPTDDMPADSTTRQGRSPTSDMTDDTAPTDNSTQGQGRTPSDR